MMNIELARREVPVMSVRDVPIGSSVFGKDGARLGTVQDVRGRFFEVVGERRYWLPLAIIENTRAADNRPLQPVPDHVVLSIGRNGLGDFQVPDSRAA
jgi:hypothetical protein